MRTEAATADIHDWLTDLRYALGNTSDKRFQHSKEVQNKAYSKYGKENLTTIGHSLGSTLAEKVGSDSNEVVTLNKPVSPYDALFHKVKDNQTDIKTKYDPVSFLRGFQRGKKSQVINSTTFNPLTEHSTAVLGRIKGEGIIDWDHMKWNSFTDQFKRFKELYHNNAIDTLEEFAQFILKNPRNIFHRQSEEHGFI